MNEEYPFSYDLEAIRSLLQAEDLNYDLMTAEAALKLIEEIRTLAANTPSPMALEIDGISTIRSMAARYAAGDSDMKLFDEITKGDKSWEKEVETLISWAAPRPPNRAERRRRERKRGKGWTRS